MATGEDPYRSGRPLSELIAPDRRRLRAVLLVLAGMVAGAALFAGAGILRARITASTAVTPGTASGRGVVAATRLSGPDGPLAFPSASRPTILNVWLQACADCMPAFEAARALEEKGGLGLDAEVVNVAYGEAEPSWAARYGVRQNLVYDRGGASVVKPLGISSFTTLVLDRHGVVVHTDRPDRAGYAERVGASVASAKTRE